MRRWLLIGMIMSWGGARLAWTATIAVERGSKIRFSTPAKLLMKLAMLLKYSIFSLSVGFAVVSVLEDLRKEINGFSSCAAEM